MDDCVFLILMRCPVIIGYGALLWVPCSEDYLEDVFMMYSFIQEMTTFLRNGLFVAYC